MHFTAGDDLQQHLGVGDSALTFAGREAFLYAPLSRPVGLARPAALRADPSQVPAEPGVDVGWFDAMPAVVPMIGTLQTNGLRWLYVGASSSSRLNDCTSLQDRLAQEVSGSVGASLPRLTLAVLLQPELRLSFARGVAGRLLLT